MTAKGFISSEDNFTEMYEDLVLSISCLADVDALKKLQRHIQQSRGGATRTERLTIEERLTHIAKSVAEAAAKAAAVNSSLHN